MGTEQSASTASLATWQQARLKQTCVYIRSPDGSSGSGYLVAPGRIGTAEHVVRSWAAGQVVEVLVGTEPTRHTCRARLLRCDAKADAAVLEIIDHLDVQALPVANRLDLKAAWSGYGFPAVASQTATANGLPIDGHVQDPDAVNDLGQASVLLYSEIIAAGQASPLHGFSGSPVVVDGALVGHLTKHIGDVDDRRRAAFGYAYACPITAVLALLDDGVQARRLDITPQPILTLSDAVPALAADEYHVFVSYRSNDRAWALSLVARLEGAGLKVFIDQQGLQAGASLAGQLEAALQRSRAAVLLVSQAWLASPGCQEEASVLMKRAVEDSGFKLVPLRLDGCEMPALLDARRWLDFNGSERPEGAKLDQLLNALIARRPPPEDCASARADSANRQVTDAFVLQIHDAAVMPTAAVLRLVTEWRATMSTDIAPLITAAEVMIGKAEFEHALGLLAGQAPTLRVRQLRAFALRKRERFDEAIPLLETLAREYPTDAETIGLLAGSYKALWLKAGDKNLARKAYQLHSDMYARQHDVFNGINAAALALHCGDKPRMYQYAGEVVDALLKRPVAGLDRWDLASLGEGFLLMERLDHARDWYGQAAAKAAGLHENIAVMRRQARLNLAALNRPRELLDNVLGVPRVLAYFGHMTDEPGRSPSRFPMAKVGLVRQAIRQRLDRLGALHGFGGAARGTDLLFLDELAGRRMSATVVLPYPESDFLASSVGGNWDAIFARLKAQAGPGLEFCPPLRDNAPPADALQAALAHANAEVLRRAIEYARRLDQTPLVVAVWDGRPGDGPGGTADAVELWQIEGYQVDVIDATQL